MSDPAVRILRKLYSIWPQGIPSTAEPDTPYMKQSNGAIVITPRGMQYLGNEVGK